MCTANGSDAVAARARAGAEAHASRCRVLRGGCYGLCEIGPNVVVRRHHSDAGVIQLPDVESDKLSLTDADNETVYSGITPADIDVVMAAHLVDDAHTAELTREAREQALPPLSPIAAKLRALRQKTRRG